MNVARLFVKRNNFELKTLASTVVGFAGVTTVLGYDFGPRKGDTKKIANNALFATLFFAVSAMSLGPARKNLKSIGGFWYASFGFMSSNGVLHVLELLRNTVPVRHSIRNQ